MYEKVFDTVRTWLVFATDKMLLNKFNAKCVPPGHPQLEAQAATHVDWKWEFMEKAMSTVEEKFPLVRRLWDKSKMLSSDSGQTLSNQTVKCMDDILKDDEFEVGSEMCLMIGEVIGGVAQDLETCDCHHFIWENKYRRKKRVALMMQCTTRETCSFMGRRLPWFVAKGKRKLLEAIRSASTPRLQILFVKLQAERRTHILVHLELLRTDCLEALREKLKFIDHAPVVAAGAFYSIYDGDVVTAKGFLRQCLDEVDEAVARGAQEKLHRKTKRLFIQGARVRIDAEAWLVDPSNRVLPTARHLLLGLLELALLPFVERKIEAVHARVKVIARASFGAGIPFVCATVRATRHLDRLLNDDEFMAFSITNWRARSLTDQILKLRLSQQELARKTFQEKVTMIYQTGISEEFTDTHGARRNVAEFKIATSESRVDEVKPREMVHQSVLYLKSVLERASVFSIPETLSDPCVSAIPPEVAIGINPVDVAMQTVLGDVPEARFDDSTSKVFQVVNLHPERRVLLPLHHMDLGRRSIIVIKMLKTSHPDPLRPHRVIASVDDSQDLVSFDLLGLVSDMQRTLVSLYKWTIRKCTSLAEARPLLAIEDLALAPDDLIPLEVASLEHAHSEAIVPYGRVQDARVGEDEIDGALQTLAKLGSFVGSNRETSSHQLQDVDATILDILVSHGVVCRRVDANREDQYSAHASGIRWTVAMGCTQPLPLARVRSNCPTLKKTKLELVMTLRQHGWCVNNAIAATETHTRTGTKTFISSFAKPLTYFACLCDCDLVFDKGVDNIYHHKGSSYYKSLLLLTADQLMPMLLELEDMPDKDIAKALKDIDIVDPNPEEEVLPIEDLPEGLPPLPLPLPPLVSSMDTVHKDEWVRKLVSGRGFSDHIKVYFDHFTSGGPKQRGFGVCSRCGVAKWRVTGRSRSTYYAGMLAWQSLCVAAGADRDAHRAMDPTDELVDAAEDAMRLEDF